MNGGHELSSASCSSGFVESSRRQRWAKLVSRLRSSVRMLDSRASQYGPSWHRIFRALGHTVSRLLNFCASAMGLWLQYRLAASQSMLYPRFNA